MITASIIINGNPIFTRTAKRSKTANPNEYLLDDGTIIKHQAEDGAVKLAIKMLETIKEQK